MALSLEFSNKYSLWASLIHQGAERVFVPTDAVHAPGSEVQVQLKLPDLPVHFNLVGNVVGVRPASDQFPAGVFVQFGEKPGKALWLAAPIISNRISDGTLLFTPDASRENTEAIVQGLTKKESKKAAKDDKW